MYQRGPTGFVFTPEIKAEVDKAYEELASVVKPITI
jgi:hypothetical protein